VFFICRVKLCVAVYLVYVHVDVLWVNFCFVEEEEEEHSSVNFLDLIIRRQYKKLEIDVYRKPTITDTTIRFFLIIQ